jgi:hypothetical protein
MIAPPFWDLMLRPGLRTSAEKSNSHAETFDGLTARLTRACAQDVHPPRKPSSQVCR